MDLASSLGQCLLRTLSVTSNFWLLALLPIPFLLPTSRFSTC